MTCYFSLADTQSDLFDQLCNLSHRLGGKKRYYTILKGISVKDVARI